MVSSDDKEEGQGPIPKKPRRQDGPSDMEEKVAERTDMDAGLDTGGPSIIPRTPEPPSFDEFQGFNSDMLKIYYSRLFPYQDMYKWLSYGHGGKHPHSDPGYFSRREFSFTLDHDIYVRYQSFRDAVEMEASIRDKCPYKIDIGAVFNVDPSKRAAYASGASERVFSPVERELVFDVDMTDYDDIRTCCTGADVCTKCWPLMTAAIKVVDTVLRDDFGFSHLLWVFSGRRGVHCWVCDGRARRLTNEQRASITEYFRVYKGSENNSKKVALTGAGLHPMLSRALSDVLMPLFRDEILVRQNLLGDESHWNLVLNLVPDQDVQDELRKAWQQGSRRGSLSEAEVNKRRWADVEKHVQKARQKNPALRRCIEEIVLSFIYPRLDFEVSKHMNHLLKAPFCIHPKTGKLCVPIDPNDCDAFDPDDVPTLASLLNELNRQLDPAGGKGNSSSKDLETTRMKDALAVFRSTFLNRLEQESKAAIAEAIHEKMRERVAQPNVTW